MATKIEALSKGGHVYTIIKNHDRSHSSPWRYIGFRDGQRWGAFMSKKEFAKAVDMAPDFVAMPTITEHYVEAMRAEMLSTWKGGQLLKDAQDALRKQKAAKS